MSLIIQNVDDNSRVSLFVLQFQDDDVSRILVVCDFVDICESVFGLLPNRAIEFRIDLIPGS